MGRIYGRFIEIHQVTVGGQTQENLYLIHFFYILNTGFV